MTIDVNAWVEAHGDYLYRFALARLRDTHQAEDVVQETFLAAVKNPSFTGKSSARTWLTGILKHKIVDLQRKAFKEQPLSDLSNGDGDEIEIDDFFDNQGHWIDKPAQVDIPEAALSQKQFLGVLDNCISKLPKKLAALYVLRDVHETDNEEICKDLAITSTNAWVMLYRARMSLRKCLELNWIKD